MNIIKTDIVPARLDHMWHEISLMPADASPRPVLVLINDYTPGNVEHAQLHKMLEASNLQADQYNILQVLPGAELPWHQLRDKLQPKIVFLIGVLPSQLGISAMFKLNEPNNFNDRIWIATISIAEQEQHPDIKKQLWAVGMKPVFVDKKFGGF